MEIQKSGKREETTSFILTPHWSGSAPSANSAFNLSWLEPNPVWITDAPPAG